MLWISSPPEKRHRVVTPLFVPKLFSRSAHFVCVTHDSSSTSHTSNHHLATSSHASTTHITKRQNLETSTTQSCFGNDRRSRRRPKFFRSHRSPKSCEQYQSDHRTESPFIKEPRSPPHLRLYIVPIYTARVRD